MLVVPSLKPMAPSPNLLRFLRSQSDTLFFTSNPTNLNANTASNQWNNGKYRRINWIRLNSAPCLAQIESSFLLVWPSVKIPTSRKSSQLRTSLTTRPEAIRSSECVNYPRYAASRNVSTNHKRWWNNWFKKDAYQKWKNSTSPPITSFTDEGAEGNLFNLGRTLASKSLDEPRLRCTEFDENGNVTLVNGEFRKSELIAKYGLLNRDLRKIDSSVLPHILVRPTTILISLLHLRVLIKADRVLVFDAYGSADSYTQSVFMYDLEGKLRQRQAPGSGALPYELRALESVLISVTSGLESEFEGVRDPVVRVLRALEEDIDRDKLRHLLVYSKKLGSFEQKARLVRDAIDDLLEADDDLAAMYLSDRAQGKTRAENDHQEVEMLLESYHKICDEIVQASGNLVTAIRNTEEVVKAILDANRNSLMLLDLKFSIGTLGLAAGTLVSALYGMNLKNFIEESDFGFGAVSATCFVCSILVSLYGLAKLRKVQRVRMWGEGVDSAGIGPLQNRSLALSNRGNWRSDAIEPMLAGLPGEGRSERLRRFREAVKSTAAKGHAAADAARRKAVSQARHTASRLHGKNDRKTEESTSGETSPKEQ
ncbi:magnesium ion transporter (Mrs2), putative [Talaromyces stipitatus ATCC 10500]|uniref:Magnesium transporter n=1 Tax=Talaromyces stipitatus (strain ATCC 10500 / CBS 375.48 / QM 6759 / NRRL 1006) TaxID=441959 RepID=B8M4W2_TALSN|nr:magnesium ion transporter (Mrs2), putative [Talaromyces stipitatus ATCC 10500]EED19397.1 magnesium ion transporter (Mrs2), putative [Talaromyces stipitatus ATCC 10500]